jgi:hypothetical protein
VKFTQPVEDHGYGLVTFFEAPGDFTVQLYQPRYKKIDASVYSRRTPGAVTTVRIHKENDMKVGVLGSGDVAQALAAGFVEHGHEVTMGTRDASKLAAFAKQHPGVRVGSFADAAKFGDVLVLAVNGNAAVDVIKAAGPANFAGKTVNRSHECNR